MKFILPVLLVPLVSAVSNYEADYSGNKYDTDQCTAILVSAGGKQLY